MQRVRALVFPVFQKDWLYFTCQVDSLAHAPADASVGRSSWSILRGVQTRIEKEWKLVQESKPGSLRSFVLKCAPLASKLKPTHERSQNKAALHQLAFKHLLVRVSFVLPQVCELGSFSRGSHRGILQDSANQREEQHIGASLSCTTFP
jgi:hypothetical protein